MKIHPIIGERYFGPALDRPALRRMPHGWSLSDCIEPRSAWEDWLLILAAVAGAALILRNLWELFYG